MKIPKCVPIDYVAWNLFNRERTRISAVIATPQLADRANELLDEVNAHLYDWHPILRSVGWKGVEGKLRTMSDFQSIGGFRETPLYRHAYRHLDADYQAAESIGYYGDRNLTMSYNRRLLDFSQREREILYLIDRRIDAVARQIHIRTTMERRVESLAKIVGSPCLDLSAFTPGEIRCLRAILLGESAPSEISSMIREKLGLENNKQLALLVVDALVH